MDNLQVIELNFNVKDILESQGVIGVDNLGDFRVDFLPPVQLDPNSNYEICLNELIMNNPTQTGGASFNPNSWILYCDVVEPSRVGTDAVQILHKTLNGADIMEQIPHSSLDYVKVTNNATIIDWKKLNGTNLSGIGFKFVDTTGLQYPQGIDNPQGNGYELYITILIRKSSSNSSGIDLVLDL
tara:strand:+ start:836 stop:1387 length:552 start_codon:yes stop_codon:yes gene_type:complete